MATYISANNGTKGYLAGPFDSPEAASRWLKTNNPKSLYAIVVTPVGPVPNGELRNTSESLS